MHLVVDLKTLDWITIYIFFVLKGWNEKVRNKMCFTWEANSGASKPDWWTKIQRKSSQVSKWGLCFTGTIPGNFLDLLWFFVLLAIPRRSNLIHKNITEEDKAQIINIMFFVY